MKLLTLPLAFACAFLPADETDYNTCDYLFSGRTVSASSVVDVTETVTLATHQWIETDPAYPGGFQANYTSPPLAVDPVSITIGTESTNVNRWLWENLHPTQPMNSTTTGRPVANMTVAHDFYARTEPGVDTLLVRDYHTDLAYSQYGPCVGQGLLAFDGVIDGSGTSGWDYQCPSASCVDTSISSSKEETYLWSAMSEAEKQRWRDGVLIGYRPEVNWTEHFGIGTPCATNVLWGSNHWWWNRSDYRSTVRIVFTATY
ncbi:MAG: hypothetical protein WBM40_12780 [Thiohalocapsa sp.]